MVSTLTRAAAGLALGLAALTANAALVGGTTRVTLDSTFVTTITGAGLSVAPRGTATLGGSPLVAAFPITAESATQIRHDGSGLRLFNATTFMNLDDFVIGLTTNLLTGTVNANGTILGAGIPLFSFDTGLNLFLTPTAAGAIVSTFSLSPAATEILSGIRVGQAALVAPSVPEPGTLALLATALGGVAFAARRRVGGLQSASRSA